MPMRVMVEILQDYADVGSRRTAVARWCSWSLRETAVLWLPGGAHSSLRVPLTVLYAAPILGRAPGRREDNMRRFLMAFAFAALGGAVLLVAPDTLAATQPTITSIIEGRDTENGRTTLVLVGKGVSKFKTFALHDTGGADVGPVELTLKASTMIALRLPATVALGDYDLVIGFGKHGEQTHRIALTNGSGVPPGTLTAAALSPALSASLANATTLSGRPVGDFALGSQVVANTGGTMNGPLTVATNGNALVATTTATSTVAITGRATSSTGTAIGVGGTSDASTGWGVFGLATATTGANVGVGGSSASGGGAGVAGNATSTTGATFGVRGEAASASGTGVYGIATGASGSTVGVRGDVASATGNGVEGRATSTSGPAWGVYGRSDSTSGIGARGEATATSGVTAGVSGSAASSSGTGVLGFATASTGTTVGVSGTALSPGGSGVSGFATSTTGSAIGVSGQTDAPTGFGVFGFATNATGLCVGVAGGAQSSSGVGVFAYTTGTGSGSSALLADHTGASGNVAVFRSGGSNVARIDKSGKGYFNGGTQTSGADFAESVAVNRPKDEFEPGDVIVIDVAGKRRFALSHEPESALVAGIYATRPGVLARPGDVATGGAWEKTEVPMAITGIVPCKVCDEGGAVRAGDLLVSATLPGYAKKAPAAPKPGTILAKALEPLDGTRGKIEVLITMR